MRRRELNARLRAKRTELRAELGRRRAAARARTGDDDRTRRRAWMGLAVIAVLLLLLLQDCSCGRAGGPPLLTAFPIGPGAEAPPDTPAPAAPVPGRIATTPRPAIETEAVAAPPWLAALRIQVAARSLRLAECFEGTTRPGALRWSVAIDADHGVVSDPVVDPTLAGQELSATQRRCVLRVLEDPPYKLATGEEPATPARVGLVIEF